MCKMADEEKNSTKQPDLSYGTVIITLDNVLIPDAKLSQTPSANDGLDMDTEIDLRILGCEFIQTAGILLRLPQVAMATGQVLFQRFYYSKSFVKHNMETVAMACINLASKVEESPRRLRDVVNVFHHIRQRRNKKSAEPLISDQKYINLKNQVIKAERRLLKELGFCVHVKHPHKMIVTYLQVLECESNTQLVRTAWNYMNDSLRTDVFIRYKPETVACACIFLSARQMGLPLPSNPPWYGLMGDPGEDVSVIEEDVEDVALTILKLYTRKTRSYEALDKKVERCRVAIQEAKLRAKGQLTDITLNSAGGTPTSFSPHSSRPNSPKANHESPGIPKMYKNNSNAIKDEPHSGSAGSNKSKENGKAEKRKGSPPSSGSSRSRSSSRGRRTDSHDSHSDRRSRDRSSRSKSPSPHHNNRKRPSSNKRKRDDHKRSRRDRDRDRSASPRHRHGHKRSKRSRSKSRTPPRGYGSRSQSRSRSRSRERRGKRHYSPVYEEAEKQSSHSRHKSRSKHRRERSRSRSRSPISRSHKSSKRDSHRSSNERRRR